MPIGTLTFKPGINTQLSQSLNRQGWSLCNLIRWKDKLPQKLGGWAKITNMAMVGLARGLHTWADLAGNPYLIAGTDQRVHLYDGGSLYDVTPLRLTANPAVDFSTTIGTKPVTIKHVAHGANVSDWIDLQTQVAVGGLVLYGYYQITSVIDADNYTITATKNATATVAHGGAVASFHTNNTLATVDVTLAAHGLVASNLYVVEIPVTVGGITISGTYQVTSITSANVFVITHSSVATSSSTLSQNGGNARILYLLPTGPSSASYPVGYGIGDYGAGDYGSGSGTGAPTLIRQWFWDSWGANAIGNYTRGPMYIWIPPVATNPRATVISAAPANITASFVAMPQQIAVALGCETGGVFDPNLVRWCAVADYTNWTASASNQAGSFRIPTGSEIVGGLLGPQQALIWTDLDLWTMRYLQPPFVFGFTRVAGGCGLISARAKWTLGTDTYWMSSGGFYVYGANGLQSVGCPVEDIIFRNLNMLQADKIIAAGNGDFDEITFYYPSDSGTGENDSYVKMNVRERDENGDPLWDYGSLPRTAWEDRSVFGAAVGADTAGLLQQHETASDADGAAMNAFVESGYTDVSNGQDVQIIDQFEPDFVSSGTGEGGPRLYLTIKSQMTPRSPVRTEGPYTILSDTQYINARVRGRQVAFRVGSNDLGSFWRLGLIRYRYAPDGRQ